MYLTPQNEAVSQRMNQLYAEGIKRDLAFQVGDQIPYYLPVSIRLGPRLDSIIDGTKRYNFSSDVMGNGSCCSECSEGNGKCGGLKFDINRFVGSGGVKSFNGIEPSKSAGTEGYTTMKLESKSGGGIVSQDLSMGLSGSLKPLTIPKKDQEPESLAGVLKVHRGGRKMMTTDEKKAWAEKMRQARQAKKSGGVKTYKKGSNKKLEGGMFPINTETAKSSLNKAKGGRRKMTEAEKKAWGEKMKQARLAKKNNK
jgi:hypothetical protein